MPAWFFASDLHGHPGRYRALFDAVAAEDPDALLLGGDLLPSGAFARTHAASLPDDFVGDFLAPELGALRAQLGARYPQVFLILGNDDPRRVEPQLERFEAAGLWRYLHGRSAACNGFTIWGYACVPPTPFGLKDWERYDVSRGVDPGCVSPEEGWRSVAVDPSEVRFGTIARDLARLCGHADLSRSVFLLHTPPYRTALDRAALDGRQVEGVPLDPHIGSIAVRRFIEARSPRITLHGHVHESPRLTGSWRDRLGATHLFSGAHDGPELALVRFDPEDPASATRQLLLPRDRAPRPSHPIPPLP
jgi:Icc-related predicted phosphoesterase